MSFNPTDHWVLLATSNNGRRRRKQRTPLWALLLGLVVVLLCHRNEQPPAHADTVGAWIERVQHNEARGR